MLFTLGPQSICCFCLQKWSVPVLSQDVVLHLGRYWKYAAMECFLLFLLIASCPDNRLHILWLHYIHLLPEDTCFLLAAWLRVRFVFLRTKMLRFENKGLESWVNSPLPLYAAGEARESAALFRQWGLGFQVFCVSGELKAVMLGLQTPQVQWMKAGSSCLCLQCRGFRTSYRRDSATTLSSSINGR